MKGTMMAPALYCLDIMLLTLGALACAPRGPFPPAACDCSCVSGTPDLSHQQAKQCRTPLQKTKGHARIPSGWCLSSRKQTGIAILTRHCNLLVLRVVLINVHGALKHESHAHQPHSHPDTVGYSCAVYLVLRVVLTRLHGGRLHAHQPLRQDDEEWSLPVDAEPAAGTLKLEGLPGSSGVSGRASGRANGRAPRNGLHHSAADRWSPAKTVEMAVADF